MTTTYVLTRWNADGTKVEELEDTFTNVSDAMAKAAEEQWHALSPDHVYFFWEDVGDGNLTASLVQHDVDSNELSHLSDKYKIEVVETEGQDDVLVPLNDVVAAISKSYLPRSRDHIIESLVLQLKDNHPDVETVVPELLKHYTTDLDTAPPV